MTQALISVIIPVYKVEKYIDRCIASLVDQTYTNLEIILVDDGSPDGCGAICDNWAARDSRIQVIHKENGGLSDARNAGIAASSGDFIFFLDGDDYLDPQTFAGLYSRQLETQADIVMCNFQYVDEKGQPLYSDHKLSVNGTLSNIEALAMLSEPGDSVNFVVSWGKLIKQELFKDIRFPVGKLNEDEFTTYKFLWKANKIAVVSESYYKYVQRCASIMGSAISVKRLDGIEAMCLRHSFYKKQDLIDLLPDMEILLRQIYCNLRRKFCYITSDKDSKTRIRQVDNMYRDIILHSTSMGLFAKLIYAYCPHLVYYWMILVNVISKGCYLAYFIIKANLMKKVIVNPKYIGHQEHIFVSFLPENCQVIFDAKDFLGDKWAERENSFKRLTIAFSRKGQLHIRLRQETDKLQIQKALNQEDVDYVID